MTRSLLELPLSDAVCRAKVDATGGVLSRVTEVLPDVPMLPAVSSWVAMKA